HRIRHALEDHLGGRTDDDRNSKSELFRNDLHRAKSRELLETPCFRKDAGGTRRDTRVDLDEPSGELRLEVCLVEEPSDLEDRALHPTDEPLDRAFLISASRCAHLDAHPELEHRLRERRVERLDLSALASLLHDCPWSVENGEERHATEADEVTNEC